jgi:hypothetical protein
VLLAVSFHVAISVGSGVERQLLVRGTELVQDPSPVRAAHDPPDPRTRTGARSRLLAQSYEGVLLRVSWPSKKCWRRCQRFVANETRKIIRVLDFELSF